MSAQVSGSIYLDSPVPSWLQVSAERESSLGTTIPASVAVHHESGAGVAVVLTFADRQAVRAYAATLLELAGADS